MTNSAQPVIHHNNFLGNSDYGVYNTSGALVIAENNWWSDAGGPNPDGTLPLNGDWVSSNVDYDPWLTEERNCITMPPNDPPFQPHAPDSSDEALNVELTNGAVTLSWSGGDPNPWDTLEYDVWFGDSAQNLTEVVHGQSMTSYEQGGLSEGTAYF